MVAAAIIGGAVIGGVASNSAAKKNSSGVKSGLKQSAVLAKQARDDAMALFADSSKRANMGTSAALDFYKKNAEKRSQPFTQGNQSAQNVISLGARQANNAILGLPVDMSFTNQTQPKADYSGIMSAKLPDYGTSFADKLAAKDAAQTQADAEAKAAKAAKNKEDDKKGRIFGILSGTGSEPGKKIYKALDGLF